MSDRMPLGLSTLRKRVGPRTLLAAMGVLVLIVALLIPVEPGQGRGSATTFSTGPNGARVAFDLAKRMGWRTTRRIAPMDSTLGPTTTQVVIGPPLNLGAGEVHRLLENVRRGGGLIFSLDGNDEIADSLGLATRNYGQLRAQFDSTDCENPSVLQGRAAMMYSVPVSRMVWRRPAPGVVVQLGPSATAQRGSFPAAVGFHLGAGRVAAVSSSAIFTNDVMMTCMLPADVVVARAFEFLETDASGNREMAFDEYHHGFGIHGGSLTAVAQYLRGTPSGRLIRQLLLAGLLLVLAMAPRPVIPRDPERIARRSPLEHADALGQAYSDVGASRTAVTRLLSGVRRRAGRLVPVAAGVDDTVFLQAVMQKNPELARATETVQRALTGSHGQQGLIAAGQALEDIERQLTTSPSHRS